MRNVPITKEEDTKSRYHYFFASILIGTMLGIPVAANSAEKKLEGHKQATGVVIQKAGAWEKG